MKIIDGSTQQGLLKWTKSLESDWGLIYQGGCGGQVCEPLPWALLTPCCNDFFIEYPPSVWWVFGGFPCLGDYK